MSVPDNYPTSEDLDILDSLPKISDTSKSSDKTNIPFRPIKTNVSNISLRLEMHQKLLSARESYMQSNDKFKEKSSLSLEDDTLDILQSIPQSNVTDEIINSNQNSQNVHQEVKRKDIMRLIEMIEIIDSCMKNELQLNEALIKLGNISGGSDKISYNDKNENCIRNKYGYILRHKEGAKNPKGIYFEKLYQVKLVIEANTKNNQANLDYLENNSEELQRDLMNIKTIIVSVLNEEKEFVPDKYKSMIHELTDPINYKMDHIIDFANTHYYPMILHRIKQEISQIEIFNFDSRENRYYLARIFTIIGEFSREYIEHNTDIHDDNIREMFKHLKTMRNLFIHCHDKIIGGIQDIKEKDCININISYILKGLNSCIEDGTLKIDHDYKIINENIQSLKRIFTKSHGKQINQNSNKISQPIETQNQPNHKNIEELIGKAYDILSENPKKMAKQLAALDRKYQVLINQISDRNDHKYPPALKVDHRSSIESYFQQQKSYSSEDVTTDRQSVNESISHGPIPDNVQIPKCENTKIVADRKIINKNKTEVIKLIKQAQKILSENPQNIHELLDKLDQKYQIIIKSWDRELSDQYPCKLDQINSIIIDKFVNDLQQAKIARPNIANKTKDDPKEHSSLSDKLNAKIKELVDETEYLLMLENLKLLKVSDKSYVIEHIISVIGQIMRDISDINSHLNALQTSNIHDFARESAVSARNQGLAHDIFAFDKNWLSKQIQNNILPAYIHFQAILTISKKDNCEISAITLFSIAFSFLNLGLYNNAVEYFRQTIDYIAKQPEEMANKSHDRINIFKKLFNININTRFEELMGMDIYTFTCRLYLMETYIKACQYDDSYKELEILKKKIQIQPIMEMKDESVSCFVYDVYNGLAHCLLVKGNNKACINLLNEIIPISNYPFFRVNLSWAYHFENNPVKAHEIITSLLPFNLDPIEKYIALFRYVRILSYQQDKMESIKEASKSIIEMEELFKENYQLFKIKYDDEFLIMQSHLVRLKVQLLVDRSALPDNDETAYGNMTEELEEYIIQFVTIIKFIKHDLQYDVRIPSMYFWICRAYSGLISDKVSDIESEKRKSENAQIYFDKARARLDYFKETGRISVSGIKEMIKTADYLAYGYNKLASRIDMDEELRKVYMAKSAPYMAIVKRYLERYQTLNIYNPLYTQIKTPYVDNKIKDVDSEIIEKAIVDKFIASKVKTNAKDVNISLNIKKAQQELLQNYCISVLKLKPDDIEFESNTCWISLGLKSIEILRQIAAEQLKKT